MNAAERAKHEEMFPSDKPPITAFEHRGIFGAITYAEDGGDCFAEVIYHGTRIKSQPMPFDWYKSEQAWRDAVDAYFREHE